ncbi:MAG: cytochrome c peroxidase, partial [Acidobacteriota bacterium]
TVSCASCHLPAKGFADPNRVSIGFKGQKGSRQAPTIINRAFSRSQFWDGRAATLEDQALMPITNPVEMANPNINAVIRRLKKDKSYVEGFNLAFPDRPGITEKNLSQAIASFERTIFSGNSPFDHFVNGDKTAVSESAARGYRLFLGKANCAACHLSFNFSDEIFHNLGIGSQTKKPDPGHFAVTKVEGHQGAFKTPTLRELTNTAPYMSDGSLKTLEEVIDYYDKGCQPNPWLSPKIKALNLNPQEKADLVEFLKSLTGEITWYGKSDNANRASTSSATQPRT